MSSSEGLFTRLASYSQNPAKKSIENFTTEVLAHLVNTDRVFRRAFVRHVIPDGRMRRKFDKASAMPQQSFGNGIVDLVLYGGESKVLVEIKIKAAETLTKIHGRGWVSQVRKYLGYKEGPVAYLTTRTVATPDVSSRRLLGHFHFEDLHKTLAAKRKRLTSSGQLFMDFMEENGMESLEPFSGRELKVASKAFLFAKKCEAMVDEIVAIVEPEFRKKFRTRARFTGGHFSPTYQSAYAWTRKFRRGNVKHILIYIEPEDGDLYYGVSVRVLRRDMKKLNRHLHWEEGEGHIWTEHLVPEGREGKLLAVRVLRDMRKLRTALNRTY